MAKVLDISPKQDGGVLKQIITEGDASAGLPYAGCRIRAHYVGKFLDGTEFDSSKSRNESFEFLLKKGQIIKGWYIGVKTMMKGEKALITCRPEYAYGENGSLPKIPPNTTLEFEIEVLDWENEDLSAENDGSIQRIIVTPGGSSSLPKDGASVDVHLEGFYDGIKFDERDVSFCLDEGSAVNVCVGIEQALKRMKQNETSKIIIQSKHVFNKQGCEAISLPPNKNVEYVVTLKSFEKVKQLWQLDNEEHVQQAHIYKTKGTKYFKEGRYELATTMYRKIKDFIQLENDDDGEFTEERKDLLTSANLNLSICYLKLKQWNEAKRAANNALEQKPDSVKALYRRGVAQRNLCQYVDALDDFQQVLKLEPGNTAAVAEIQATKKEQKKNISKEKKIYENMFEKFARRDAEKEEEFKRQQPDVMNSLGEWGQDEREREPTKFEKENPNILMLNNDGEFKNM